MTHKEIMQFGIERAKKTMNVIRDACKNLKTYNLIGCGIYATGYPCPMFMSAIIWANIKRINDCNDKNVVDIEKLESSPAVDLYKEYSDTNKTIY